MREDSYFAVVTEEMKALPFYVVTVGVCKNEKHVYRPKGIEDYLLLYCAKGEGVLHIDSKEEKITPGMGFCLPPGMRHHYYAKTEPWETRWITFSGMGVEQAFSFGTNVFKVTHTKLYEKLFWEILNVPNNEWGVELRSVALYNLLIHLKKCIAIDTNLSVLDIQQQLAPITDYIKENYQKPLELGELAKILDITPSHLCRLFKAAYNARPFEYITRLRLQKAKELLASRSDLSIGQISLQVGYPSPSYFNMLFKRQEAITPATFRSLYLRRII